MRSDNVSAAQTVSNVIKNPAATIRVHPIARKEEALTTKTILPNGPMFNTRIVRAED
jgi:hypothetical protein